MLAAMSDQFSLFLQEYIERQRKEKKQGESSGNASTPAAEEDTADSGTLQPRSIEAGFITSY